ncbi:MAG: ABC transporter permease [Candidatus Heimdallarchaeaceae archaeon]
MYESLEEIGKVFSTKQIKIQSIISGFSAIFKRNISIIAKYKLKIFNSFLNSFIAYSMYFFVSLLLPKQVIATESYTVSGVSYIFSGLLIASYGTTILGAGLGSLTNEMRQGTFESIVLTPYGLKKYIIIEIISEVIYYSFQNIIFLFPILLIYPFTSSLTSFTLKTIMTLIILLLAYILFMSILTLTSSLIVVVLKRGREIALAISGLLHFLGGILYPISVFPKFLQAIALASPLTQAISAFREILFTGAVLTNTTVWSAIIILLVYACVLVCSFNWLYKKVYLIVQKKGSISHY